MPIAWIAESSYQGAAKGLALEFGKSPRLRPFSEPGGGVLGTAPLCSVRIQLRKIERGLETSCAPVIPSGRFSGRLNIFRLPSYSFPTMGGTLG